jgi:hypothetical protein
MESSMTMQTPTRCRTDGSIDTDFYRHQCLMERHSVMTGFVEGLRKIVRPAIAVASIIAAICVMPGRDGTGWTAPSARVVVLDGHLIGPKPTTEIYALNGR